MNTKYSQVLQSLAGMLTTNEISLKKPVHRPIALFLMLLFLQVTSLPGVAQSWGTVEGLMQADRIARVSLVYQDTLRASADTTSWIPFGTHDPSLAGERLQAPRRFTLFVKVDTAEVPHAADPAVWIRAEIALTDTAEAAYSQYDGSLNLVPSSWPIETVEGQSVPVPVYGGGWLRFIVQASDTAAVKMHLWSAR